MGLIIDVTKVLDEKLLTDAQVKRDEKGNIDNNTFYPSSAGYCIRKQWFERKYPKIFPVQTYKHFLMGNLLHEWVQKNLFPNAINEESIQWTDKGLKIRGRIDCISDGIIYEFKSIKNLHYVKEAPKEEHVKQLNLYLHAKGYDKGVIVYFTKDDFSIVQHEVLYDNKLYNSTLREFKLLKKYLINNVEPKKLCKMSWFCDYCKEAHAKNKDIIAKVKAKKAKK